MKKLLLLFLPILLLSSVSWSQTHVHHAVANPTVVTQMQASMNHADQLDWVDNKPNCVVAAGHTCGHAMLGTANGLLSFSVGSDSYALLIDSSRNVQQYKDFPDNTFTLQSQFGNQMMQIAVADDEHIAGLAATGTVLNLSACSSLGSNSVYTWNGSAWVSANGCANNVAIGSDGYLVASNTGTVAANRGVYISTNSGSTWTTIVSGSTALFPSCSARYNNYFYCTKSDGTLWYKWGGAWTQGAPPFGSTAKYVAVDLAGNVWVLTSQQPNDLWRYDRTAATWTRFYDTVRLPLAGQANQAIMTGGPMLTYYIGLNVANNPILSRFPDYTVQFSTDIHGTTTCSPPPCPHSTHQPHITFDWGSKMVGAANQSGPTMYADQYDQSNRYAVSIYDPFDWFSSSTPLNINVLGIDCAIAGANFVKFIFTVPGGGTSGNIFPGNTNFKANTGVCSPGSICDVTPACSSDTTPPNYADTPQIYFGLSSQQYIRRHAICGAPSSDGCPGALCHCIPSGFTSNSTSVDKNGAPWRCAKGQDEGNLDDKSLRP